MITKIKLLSLVLALSCLPVLAAEIDASVFFNRGGNTTVRVFAENADTVVFTENTSYILRGRNLDIIASNVKIIGDVTISSFAVEDIAVSSTNGNNAGQIYFNIENLDVTAGKLTLNMRGQQGGVGRNGQIGATGATGSAGQDARCEFGRSHSASPGGRGLIGHVGERGYIGAQGGNGASITYSGQAILSAINEGGLIINVDGGAGGIGGIGGPGGPGGPGGRGGKKSGIPCNWSGKGAGQQGPPGGFGQPGPKGARGASGTYRPEH